MRIKQEEVLTRALSIRQPYAEAILRGTKAAEYRSRLTRLRERVYLYAALTLGDLEEGLTLGISPEAAPKLPRGVIVDCQQLGDRQYAWALARPKCYPVPVRPKGQPQPGFWCPRWSKFG